ncbi:MAG: hypothetical protein KKB56_17605 [Gammaproteobacteria bacterium]|nr:hypothetical protein [Alphaproteobacteria bacterium]MBU1774997.1 hypothetical protein [Gammaproteobacteria bacterium]
MVDTIHKETHQVHNERWQLTEQGKEMTTIKEKNLPLGICLNLLLPGLGYIYMGRWFLGVIAGALILAIIFSAPAQNVLVVWLVMNLIMLIDIILLHGKNRKKYQSQNMMQCCFCAELIQKQAKICKHCKEAVTQ